jgi:hypothetical protein
MVDLAAQRQKVENIAAADRAFDVLSGAVVRIFTRIEEVEIELRRHRERLRALEKTLDSDSGDGPKVAPTSGRQHIGMHQWRKRNGEGDPS